MRSVAAGAAGGCFCGCGLTHPLSPHWPSLPCPRNYQAFLPLSSPLQLATRGRLSLFLSLSPLFPSILSRARPRFRSSPSLSFRGAPLPSHLAFPPRRPTPTSSLLVLSSPRGRERERETTRVELARSCTSTWSAKLANSSLGGNMEIRALRHRSMRERERGRERKSVLSWSAAIFHPPSFSR